ncbi:MAG: hypothetical protein A3G05_00380 [Candidatus Zambryskibacteria bacterium RIFCSPLOWO2_12_FULL_45_14]|uniref:Uncharacterized protein n=2 Tax=Candidatus Zambryskiibacteriota TaxID=1817925 RepID=A0A1G2UL81_9BACT|nr:MAG: hypothetical protein A3H60_02785 [Candidatus Zambryskibacteria bacterium RIFCSPLOWO2_02_FULL_44_12b]OHB13412.1 MAG: hypothetical protein A3G05_00380 [Candidatus Zambryskibacteria bacterium RIFCSPLOWO2_12_FULL_45_14]
MITISIFTVSGLSIVLLIVAKKIEEKRKKPLFISNLISRGDIHIRKFYHTAVHLYSEGKEKGLFLLKKQIPIHSRNSLNKTISFLKEKRGQYINNMRDSRLLKKSDGISEFFKNMSEVEKGNGTIHDVYEDSSQNIEEKVK